MIIGLYIGLAIVGLLALIRGRMQISKTKIVVGIPARLLGLMAFTPLPMALVAVTIYLLVNAPLGDPQAAERFAQEHKGTVTLIEGVCAFGVALLLFVIAAMVAVSPEEAERRQRRRTWADHDDYVEDDNLPRRPRPAEDVDDEEDRPRRRRDDLDERAR